MNKTTRLDILECTVKVFDALDVWSKKAGGKRAGSLKKYECDLWNAYAEYIRMRDNA